MRGGLRWQLLLLLGALLLISYVPLFFAVSTYTRVGLERLQRDNSLKLAGSATSYIKALRATRSDEDMNDVARLQVESGFVHGLSLLSPEGQLEVAFGDPELIGPLRQQSHSVTTRQVSTVQSSLGPAVFVLSPDPRGTIGVMMRVDSEVTGSKVLVQLMGLYMALAALTLVSVAYFAITRWMVRPILLLGQAADRVAGGSHRLLIPPQAPLEIAHLATRLVEMTERLRQDEESLRQQMLQIERKTEELKTAQNSLVRSERLASVGRLAAGLAHEVGNPISALMGLLDLVSSGDLTPEEERDFLERMKREIARIDRVISDLLAFARKPQDRPSATPGRGSVRQAVRDISDLLKPQKQFQDISILQDLDEKADQVKMIHEELMQVLLNLLMNAADACGDQGTIRIHTEQANDTVVLSVEDSGPGIAAEVADSLFEPFVSTKEVGKGTGLGLSVTKGLVESAGGLLTVTTGQLGGARFEIVLPAAGDPPPN